MAEVAAKSLSSSLSLHGDPDKMVGQFAAYPTIEVYERFKWKLVPARIDNQNQHQMPPFVLQDLCPVFLFAHQINNIKSSKW